ncbi:D-inositol 3-phosphate glycosyltransferase [Pirellulimonas nuda]|uniref:D-inositol 3-phosphate glycosyltransferase n=1 Tax=Pirellulimonas nuda TaxID=2528009 RepID=A0A518DEU7_9BACT|nr:glycosyltransferase family 4 protein [Pirellulimonas nuda]QDU90000.1 D-inositol 3-phosphate glycosyltransferase [Pirellulimonas nuda]
MQASSHHAERRPRPRILLVAYACHQSESMESRLGFRRALSASQRHDVTVMYAMGPEPAELAQQAAAAGGGEICFQRVEHSDWDRRFCDTTLLYYIGYRGWHRRVLKEAQAAHAARPFDLVHQVNFCGFREPGEAWRLDAPFVWGPVGGTEGYPPRFLNQTNLLGGAREVFRMAVNSWQLRCSRRVHGAGRRAAYVLTANTAAQQALQKHLGVDSQCDLETGVDLPDCPPRELRDPSEPLRVLWAGRLKTWKGLPLLIRAIAQLPPDRRPIVRVLGQGDREPSWRRLARRHGVADRMQWVGWPTYDAQLPHYRWADVFAFTSLRDTSGTGLLEALAAGAPIVGLDHSGAGDIMTPGCAIPVAVRSPKQAISDFAAALGGLQDDSERLLRLSRGARRRAEDFSWEARAAVMDAVYTECLAATRHRAAAPSSRPLLPTAETQATLSPVSSACLLTSSGARR